jgi:hypothetical protein
VASGLYIMHREAMRRRVDATLRVAQDDVNH